MIYIKISRRSLINVNDFEIIAKELAPLLTG